MKDEGLSRRYQYKHIATSTIVILTALLILNIGAVFAASEGEHDDEHAAPKGWVATDTFRVMNFAVLAIVLFFLLKKPVSQALGARIKGIKDQLEELEEKKKTAQKQLAEYNQKLSTLDGEAEKIIQEYIKQGEEAQKRIIKEAEETATKLEEQAKKHIEHEFKQARDQLQEEVMQRALAEAEEIIKRKITAEDQERLVDEYLKKVVA
jgi:F-type H+-transporting ATPase subunit b